MPDRMPRAAGEVKPRRSRLLWVGLPVFTVFAVFAVVVWLAYQENARVPTGEPPLIRAIAAPYKVAPDDPGGRQVADQGEINQLLRDEPRPALPERVLPLPEEPRAPVIRAAPQSPAPAVTADAGEQPKAVAEAPAGAPSSSAATQEAEAALARLLADVGPATSSGERTQAPAEPAAESTAEEPAASASDAVAVPAMRPASPPSTTAPTVVRRAGPEVATAVDVPSREADAALTRLLAEVAGLPADAAPEPAPAPSSPPAGALAAIAPADLPDAGRPVGRGYRVQLAAVREQDAARRAWASLADRLGPLLADHEPVFERAETVNGVFYRVQLGPFASERAADRLCVELQRRDASCFVVGP